MLPSPQPNSLANSDSDQLMNMYRQSTVPLQKDTIMRTMKQKGYLPNEEDMGKMFEAMGAYPDTDDPNFLARLLKKTEFADTKSTFIPGESPCDGGANADFEVTPVQRFVGNFLHPRTPYMSALLYHGVGVGKTCAAIQAAEAYLDVFPRRKVIIVAPPTIQEGFYRTIFDEQKLVIASGNAPNSIQGCTGETYLRLTGCLFERDRPTILRRVKRAIERRYMSSKTSKFLGYVQFRNYIR